MLLASSAGVVESEAIEVHDGDSLGLAIFMVLFWVVLGTLLLWCFAALAARYQMVKTKARVLDRAEAPAVFELLNEEWSRLGIAERRMPKLYVSAWNARVSARVLGGFGFKIIVSGGMCVLAARKRETARMILDHELAHLRNGDTRLWSYVVLVAIGVIFVLTNPANILYGLAATVVQTMFLVFLLRRREYLADAVAVNSAESAANYLSVLTPGIDAGRRWFHPPIEGRRRAIEFGSPVLCTDELILFFYAVVVFGGLAQVAGVIREGGYFYPGSQIFVNLVLVYIVLNIVPAAGAISELSKGSGEKRPQAAGHLESSKLPG